jgi:heme/copper-type cytochrome/quinol oxidase subunit 1
MIAFMHVIDGLNKAQRIVVVVAIGVAFGVLGNYLVNLGTGVNLGWFAYAPLSSAVHLPGTGLPTWLRLIIWLGLIGLWALISVGVLRESRGDGRKTP